MKTGKRTLRISVATLLLVCGTAAIARPGGGRRGWGAGPGGPGRGDRPARAGMLGVMGHRLDLTEEQTEKIADISREARIEAKETSQAVAEARKAFGEVARDGADEEEIRGAADALGRALAAQAIHQSKTRSSIREVLTEEQRAQLKEARERGARFRGRREGQGRGMRSPRQRGGRGMERGCPMCSKERPSRGGRSQMGPRGPHGRRPMSDEGGPRRRGRFSDSRGPEGRFGRPNWKDNESPARGRGRGGQMGGRGSQEAGPVFLDRMFERGDANDDGMLSKDEIKAFRDKAPRRRGPQWQ